MLHGLVQKGWVEAATDVTPGMGRPAQRYALSRAEGSVLGLDVGAHVVRAVRTDLTGGVTARVELEVAAPGDTDALRERVAEALAGCLEGTDVDEVWASTLAVGGHLDKSGMMVRSVAIPAWDGQRPLEIFADLLPQPCSLSNDMHAQTFAEHEVGAAKGVDDFALAHLGRRPTLGICLDGRIRRGAHGTAGDLSQHPQLGTGESDPPDDCGEDRFGETVRRARAGDEAARREIRAALERISEPLALTASVLDLSVLVIGGPFAAVPELAVPVLARAFDEISQGVPELRTTGLDQFAAAIGAARRAHGWVDSVLISSSSGVLPRQRERFRAEVEGLSVLH